METTETDPQSPKPVVQHSPTPRTSGLATASLVLAILGPFSVFLTTLPAVVLGVVSLIQIRRNRAKLVGGGMAIAGIVISVLVVVILYPWFILGRETGREAECSSNLKMVSLALLQYADDYNERFPPTAGWNQAIYPYTKSSRVLTCPTAHSKLPAYAMNKSLGSVSLKSVQSPKETAEIYESVPGVNQAGGPELLPVPGRHLGHNFIGFADGHVSGRGDGNYSSIRWKP